MRPKDKGGVGQVMGERKGVQVEAEAWAELRSKTWPGTSNMVVEERNKVRSCRLLNFILDP